MVQITMQSVIQKLEQGDFFIPVEKLTETQKYGMIEYAFINKKDYVPQIMNLLLGHTVSSETQRRYIQYLFLTIKQNKDFFPIELLKYRNLSTYFKEEQIMKLFQLVNNRIGNHMFEYDQLLQIVEITILPHYVKGNNSKKDFYYKLASQIQKQIYRQIQHEMNTSLLEHKKLLLNIQELPHQYGDYLNRVKEYQKTLKK